ncbi:hypothetical protein L195_g048071, partial [Trifolium pratense]
MHARWDTTAKTTEKFSSSGHNYIWLMHLCSGGKSQQHGSTIFINIQK